jgi:signal transduction histidine kinase
MLVERRTWGRAAYFPVQLAATAGLLACARGAMTLAPLALVCHAVLYLRPRWAVAVVIAIVAVTVTADIAGALSYLTSVAFVVAFSWIAIGQHDQRDRASELASTRERNRIAREVHDGLGHALTIAHIQLEAALEIIRTDPARAEQIVERVRSVVQHGLRDVRSSVGLLRETPRPVVEAIATWAAQLRAEGLDVVVELPPQATMPAALAHVLYRAAQEAMTNVRKHAHATKVEIAMTRDTAGWQLRVADDGRGAGALDHGFGLEGIRERAASVGGRVAITTTPGQGFVLTLDLPASHAA